MRSVALPRAASDTRSGRCANLILVCYFHGFTRSNGILVCSIRSRLAYSPMSTAVSMILSISEGSWFSTLKYFSWSCAAKPINAVLYESRMGSLHTVLHVDHCWCALHAAHRHWQVGIQGLQGCVVLVHPFAAKKGWFNPVWHSGMKATYRTPWLDCPGPTLVGSQKTNTRLTFCPANARQLILTLVRRVERQQVGPHYFVICLTTRNEESVAGCLLTRKVEAPCSCLVRQTNTAVVFGRNIY